MRTFCKATMIAVSLLLCTNGIQAQITQTELNQVELMEQFIGNWKCEIRDTIWTMDCKSFSQGLEFYITAETKGEIVIKSKSLMSYEIKSNKLIERRTVQSNPEITNYVGWFTSEKEFKRILLKDIANPEKTDLNWDFVFGSEPDLMVTETQIIREGDSNSKARGIKVKVYPYNRQKK